jgi:hypothetical protein
MKSPSMAITIVVGLLLSTAPSAFSQDRWGGLLTPSQSRAYHACLFESWIQDYCHWNSFAYPQCVIANGGGRYPLDGRLITESYCWYTAQGLAPPGLFH